jgi:hypothetical protein
MLPPVSSAYGSDDGSRAATIAQAHFSRLRGANREQTFSSSTVCNNEIRSISWRTSTNQTGPIESASQSDWSVLVSWSTVLKYYVRSMNWKSVLRRAHRQCADVIFTHKHSSPFPAKFGAMNAGNYECALVLQWVAMGRIILVEMMFNIGGL